jgi:hypothetical protein
MGTKLIRIERAGRTGGYAWVDPNQVSSIYESKSYSDGTITVVRMADNTEYETNEHCSTLAERLNAARESR